MKIFKKMGSYLKKQAIRAQIVFTNVPKVLFMDVEKRAKLYEKQRRKLEK